MKQTRPVAAGIFFFLLAFAIFTSCNKPSPFGAELLDDQLADFDFTDTLTLRFTVEKEDSIYTTDNNSGLNYMLCGEIQDPFFGKFRSDIYTLFRLTVPGVKFQPAIDRVDSVVMFLRYNSAGVYGDTTQAQTLRVYRLGEALDWGKNYYSNQSLATGAQIGIRENFLPLPNLRDSLFTPGSRGPYLRIPLDKSLGEEILNYDSATLATDTAFWKAVRGLKIECTSLQQPGAMLAFNLNDDLYSIIRLYYSRNDTVKLVNDFEFLGGTKFNQFTHDYAGSPAGQQIGQVSDDLLYLQGAQGLRLKVEFPTAESLDNIVINKAELEFTVAAPPGEAPSFTPATQLSALERLGDTVLIPIDDVRYSLGPSNNGGYFLFGGFPEKEIVNDNQVIRYRLTLSQHFQDVVDGTNPKVMYIRVVPQFSSPMRAILYGPKSVTYPARLSLKYTRLP